MKRRIVCKKGILVNAVSLGMIKTKMTYVTGQNFIIDGGLYMI